MKARRNEERRVVFVCPHGAARSVLAAAQLDRLPPPRGGGRCSAGTTCPRRASTTRRRATCSPAGSRSCSPRERVARTRRPPALPPPQPARGRPAPPPPAPRPRAAPPGAPPRPPGRGGARAPRGRPADEAGRLAREVERLREI